MTGATSSTAGAHGLVPAPVAGDDTKYLKGDGTWGELTLPSDMTGATSSVAGAHGLVPAPVAGDDTKYLKGDGTWDSPSSLPSVSSSDNGKILKVVSGAWAAAENGGGEELIAPAYDSTSTYAVGNLCIYEHNLYRCSTAIGTAENWDSTHWTQTTIAAEIATLASQIATLTTTLGRAAFLSNS